MGLIAGRLAVAQCGRITDIHFMWNEPYLETCCRSALHRLSLSGRHGRPHGLKDEPCLERLTRKGLACVGEDSRFHITQDGEVRHRSEVLKQK